MLDINDFNKKQIIFMFANRGDSVQFRNDNILIRDAEKKIKLQVTCYRVILLVIVGHTTITTGLIQRCRKFGFKIALMTPGFRLYQIIGNDYEGNTLLRLHQYQYDSLGIAKHLTHNKLYNQRQLLMEIRSKTAMQKNAIKYMDTYLDTLAECTSLEQLMGYEGSAAKVYFENYFDNVEWKGRKPRIKNDMINAILDLGYSMLFTFVELLLSLYGFDLYYGVMHRCFYMRKSLVCDLVEPFRVIIDKQTKKSIALRQFKEEDFNIRNFRYELKWEKSPDYVTIFLEAILCEKEEIFRYIRDYYRCFMKQKDASAFPVYKRS